MQFDLPDHRNVDGSFHLALAEYWLSAIELNLNAIPYCAFELRLLIERLSYEFAVISNKNKIIKGDLHISQFTDFKSFIMHIHDNVGNRKRLYKHFLFTQLYVKHAMELSVETSIVDFGKLDNYWGQLSELCHSIKIQEESWSNLEWLKSKRELLMDIYKYFVLLFRDRPIIWLKTETMPPAMVDIYIRYLDGELNDKNVLKAIEIARPIYSKTNQLIINPKRVT